MAPRGAVSQRPRGLLSLALSRHLLLPTVLALLAPRGAVSQRPRGYLFLALSLAPRGAVILWQTTMTPPPPLSPPPQPQILQYIFVNYFKIFISREMTTYPSPTYPSRNAIRYSASTQQSASHCSTINQHVFRNAGRYSVSHQHVFRRELATLPSDQHFLSQLTNISFGKHWPSFGQPPSYFLEGSNRCLASHHHVFAILPFGNHAPPIGQPPSCVKSGSHFNRRTTVSFQL